MFVEDEETITESTKNHEFHESKESEEHKELWGARPGCDGQVVTGSFGGVRCTKCPGWFCY